MIRSLARLIVEWTMRRAVLRTLLADPNGSAWLYSIRVRILSFLLTRYERAAVEQDAREPLPEAQAARPTFCTLIEPVYSPPREHRFLAGKLRAISRCNVRRRWRFWP